MDTIVVWLNDSLPLLISKFNQMLLRDGYPEHLINVRSNWHTTIVSIFTGTVFIGCWALRHH